MNIVTDITNPVGIKAVKEVKQEDIWCDIKPYLYFYRIELNKYIELDYMMLSSELANMDPSKYSNIFDIYEKVEKDVSFKEYFYSVRKNLNEYLNKLIKEASSLRKTDFPNNVEHYRNELLKHIEIEIHLIDKSKKNLKKEFEEYIKFRRQIKKDYQTINKELFTT